ncbi:protein-S-isoprenylcysteine O-methyltransferase [Naematelia encephala]|uniref:Protein-S-isoprenylcysteine O-methyltransferase n=1 Tax=Naematelia encephala TaxID=71784 RepID=A0A1Y2AY20_9TREE|nr:protein-S-isoprenylcysteine O-methyltransferase [Naematelia encephala]
MSFTKTTISSPQPAARTTLKAQQATSALLPHAPQYTIRGSIPNTPLVASLISAGLGGVATASLAYGLLPLFQSLDSTSWTWARWQLGVYGFAWGLFHLAEFWTTAGWNTQKLSVDAFLLNNTSQYHFAHLVGLSEYFISSYFFPRKFDSFITSLPFSSIVMILLIGGQAFRSLAMIHAAQSFSHIVKAVKLEDHELVTHGVYAWSRHPSYAGFFYWAIATQLLLGNIVSTLGFAIVLGRFFSARIKDEERHLVRFFGDDYIQYRKRVGTGLPLILSSA